MAYHRDYRVGFDDCPICLVLVGVRGLDESERLWVQLLALQRQYPSQVQLIFRPQPTGAGRSPRVFLNGKPLDAEPLGWEDLELPGPRPPLESLLDRNDPPDSLSLG